MTTPQHPFVDMHTHLFTARYLPLQGILMSFTKGRFRRLSRGVARLIYSITGESQFDPIQPEPPLQSSLEAAILTRDADGMMRHVTGPMRRLLRRVPTSAFRLTDQPSDVQNMILALDDIRADLPGFDEMPDDLETRRLGIERPGSKSVYEDEAVAPDELDALIRDAFLILGKALESADFLDSVAHLHIDGPFADGTDRGFRALSLDETQVRSLRQILLFLVVMAMSERTRFKLLERDFGKDKPDDGYDAEHYVGVLMDMTGSYDSFFKRDLLPPPVSFKSQMEKMHALSRETSGKLVSYGAVDPFREDWQEHVDHGRNNGARGFKLYCPLGVRPIDDGRTVTPVDLAHPENSPYAEAASSPVPDQIAQSRMRPILQYFAENELRMYTHCTPIGFQVKTGFGVFGDPELWGEAMDAYEAKSLWLFLAHGGGGTHVDWGGWDAPVQEMHGDPDGLFWYNTFAGRAIRLAERSHNVYLGSAFYNALEHHAHHHDGDNPRDRIRERMRRILTTERPGTVNHVSTRLCFGTDWSMPMAIGRTRELLESYYEFFDDLALSEIAPLFFRENAVRFIGSDTIA